jgi:hypothetical protein
MSKLIILVSVLVVLGIGVTAVLRTPQENLEAGKSIAAVARRAKAEGRTSVVIPGPILEYPNMGADLDTLLTKYSAVVVEVAESKSFIADSDPDGIRTAYKFRIIEPLTQKAAAACESCPALTDISNQVSPATSNEFILEVAGGSVSIDGVAVTMTNSGKLTFEKGKKYLLLVSFTPGGMARLAAGPSSVFKIHDDESIEPMANPKNSIPSQVAARFANNLTRFKQAARRF